MRNNQNFTPIKVLLCLTIKCLGKFFSCPSGKERGRVKHYYCSMSNMLAKAQKDRFSHAVYALIAFML